MFFSQDKTERFINNIIETDEIRSSESNLSVDDLIQQLVSLELKSGSVVMLLFNNSALLIKYIIAIIKAGYVPALVPPSTPTSRINDIAEQFNAKVLLKNRINIDGIKFIRKFIDFGHYQLALLNTVNEVTTQSGELILTTSGTSGFSSGCVFDFSALLKNAEKHVNAIGIKQEDRLLVNLPLYYSYAFVAQALAAYMSNATLVISAPPFNNEVFANNLQDYAITICSLTPLLIKEITAKGIALPQHLRAITVGGDSLNASHIEAFLKKYPVKELYITYGITEAGPRVATLAAHQESAHKFSSVGFLLPNTFATFAGEPDNNEGELLIHSDTLVKRRLGNPNKPVFISHESRLWLKTGDVFSMDKDGYLYFKSRISDFVILNGEKVNLAGIKNLIANSCDVLSSKVNLIKNNHNELIGYELDIIVPYTCKQNSQKIHTTLQQNLKIFERPKNILISQFGEINVERYK